MRKHLSLFFSLLFGIPPALMGQTVLSKSADGMNIREVVAYSLTNSPMIRQSELDLEIGEQEIKSSISGWFPQINANYALNDNIKLQTQPIGGELIRFGQPFSSNLSFQVNQTIFNRDQFAASKAADLVRADRQQTFETNQINTAVEAARAYYNVLLTQEQIRILSENIVRQQKQFEDAKNRFDVGLVDKTDYQRASIALANLQSEKNAAQSMMKARFASLKEVMGFPTNEELVISYDYDSLETRVEIDTTLGLSIENRVEYQLAKTQFASTQLQTNYAKWAYIPTVSGFYNYNFLYFNSEFSDLYNQSYPTSTLGLTVGIPIFQGGKRAHEVKIARLQEERAEIGLGQFEQQLNTEYETSLANYKASYGVWVALRDNMILAEEVYNTIKLQYDEGVKAYVDLIVAETDLRTAQLNNYNALFTVLSSKLDLMRAMGQIKPSSLVNEF